MTDRCAPQQERDRAVTVRWSNETFDARVVPEIAPLHRFLRRMGVREADIDDVVQEVLIAVMHRWSEYDPSRPLRPWLFAFATRTASSWRRSARSTREALHEPEAHSPVDSQLDPQEHVEARQRRQAVLDALQTLEDDQRAVLVMIDLEHMSAPEVSAALSVNLNTVYSRLRLGRAAFTAAVRRWTLQRGAV